MAQVGPALLPGHQPVHLWRSCWPSCDFHGATACPPSFPTPGRDAKHTGSGKQSCWMWPDTAVSFQRSTYSPHSLGERAALTEPASWCRRQGQDLKEQKGGRWPLKQPQAAGSSSSWQALLGCARPGSMRDPLLNKKGRADGHPLRALEPTGSASFSLVNFTPLILRKFIFAKAWTLLPINYPLGPWQVRKYCLRKEEF